MRRFHMPLILIAIVGLALPSQTFAAEKQSASAITPARGAEIVKEAASLGLGRGTLAFIITSIEKSRPSLEQVFGPLAPSHVTTFPDNAVYRGKSMAGAKINLATARVGDQGFVFVEPVAGIGPHRELLEKRGDGVPFFIYSTDNYEKTREMLESKGFKPVFYGEFTRREGGKALIHYLECPPGVLGGSFVEVIFHPKAD